MRQILSSKFENFLKINMMLVLQVCYWFVGKKQKRQNCTDVKWSDEKIWENVMRQSHAFDLSCPVVTEVSKRISGSAHFVFTAAQSLYQYMLQASRICGASLPRAG